MCDILYFSASYSLFQVGTFFYASSYSKDTEIYVTIIHTKLSLFEWLFMKGCISIIISVYFFLYHFFSFSSSFQKTLHSNLIYFYFTYSCLWHCIGWVFVSKEYFLEKIMYMRAYLIVLNAIETIIHFLFCTAYYCQIERDRNWNREGEEEREEIEI